MNVGFYFDPTHYVPEAVHRFITFAQRFSYKPGVDLSVRYDGLNQHLHVTVIAPALDARDWDKPVKRETKVQAAEVVRVEMLHGTVARFTDYSTHIIREAIRRYELHEMDEWLRFDGKHVKDPHPRQPTP